MRVNNSITLIGHVGQDPEVKVLEGGNKVANFSLATNYAYTNKNGDRVTETQWHNIVAWGNSVNVIENYVKKGSHIAIAGRLEYTSYMKDEIKISRPQIILEDIHLLGKND